MDRSLEVEKRFSFSNAPAIIDITLLTLFPFHKDTV